MKTLTLERLDRHDRQIAAIRALIQEGMRLVVETRRDIRALATAQRRTEENLQTLINTLRRGGNGHSKGKAAASIVMDSGISRSTAHSYRCRKLRR